MATAVPRTRKTVAAGREPSSSSSSSTSSSTIDLTTLSYLSTIHVSAAASAARAASDDESGSGLESDHEESSDDDSDGDDADEPAKHRSGGLGSMGTGKVKGSRKGKEVGGNSSGVGGKRSKTKKVGSSSSPLLFTPSLIQFTD